MAETLYLHLLIVSTKNGSNKRHTIDTVLNWSSSPVTIQEDLVAALTPGIANPGQYFPRQVAQPGRLPDRIRGAVERAGSR